MPFKRVALSKTYRNHFDFFFLPELEHNFRKEKKKKKKKAWT